MGDNRLTVFITDGEGSTADIDAARARLQIACHPCKAILSVILCCFPTRQDVWNETPIGQVAETLGCKVTVPRGAGFGGHCCRPCYDHSVSIFIDLDYFISLAISGLDYLSCLSRHGYASRTRRAAAHRPGRPPLGL
jgi:hypothetical protein